VTALVHSGVMRMAARANWGRWIVDCGRCENAIWAEPYLTLAWSCRWCDGLIEVVWPDPDMVAGVERLLMQRPNPKTRNWVPGETLSELMLENGKAGVYAGLNVTPKPGEQIMAVDDYRIRVDTLPELPNRMRKAITA
jgi:hypothetical protein